MEGTTRSISIKRGIEILLVSFFARYPISEILKRVIARPRPDPTFDGFAFPSGHATFFFALATGVYLVDRRMGVIFYVVAVVVSAMRVIEGAHYVSDVIGGAILGIAVAYVFARLLHDGKFVNLNMRTK